MTGLQQLRLDSGMTRKQLAKKVGIDAGTILDIEGNRRETRQATLAKLSTHFGVPASYLVSEVNHEIREAA